jgi:alpha-mannosidase
MSLKKLMGLETTDELGHCNCNSAGAESCLNMTICGHTTGTDTFTVAAWNPQGQTSTQMIHVPVVGGTGWTVQDLGAGVDASTALLPSQAIPISSRTLELPMLYLNSYNMTDAEQAAWRKKNTNPATHVLSIQVTMPAMGYTTVVATRSATAEEETSSSSSSSSRVLTDGTTTVSNGRYELTFDGTTGLMTSVTNVVSNITTPLSIEWGWYNSSVGGCTDGIEPHDWSCDSQKSGAYIFRPNSSTFFYPGSTQTPTVEIMTQDGGLVTEVRQTFSEWATHVVRLYKGDDELASYIEKNVTLLHTLIGNNSGIFRWFFGRRKINDVLTVIPKI